MKIEAVDFEKDQWQKDLVEIKVTDGDRIIDYQGHVLIAVPDTAHEITFAVKTSALRPAEIDIPLQFPARASVRLFVNDELVETLEFSYSNDPSRIHHLTKDITRWTESRQSSRVQLFISYFGEQATTTILLDAHNSQLEPKLIQKWSWAYGLQSLFFFAFAWSSIVGLAIILLAHLQPLGDTFRFYAVVIAVISWVAGVLGLPDAARIPLRSMLRSLYSRTNSKSSSSSFYNRRRPLWLASLFLVSVLVGSGAGAVIYCLAIRQYYSSLIYQALDESDWGAKQTKIRQALRLLPWRKEAQMLFENQAYDMRKREDMENFRRTIREFARDQDVKQAITNAPDENHLPLCLTKSAGSTFLNDPVVWYASTIIEGEGFQEKQLMNEAVSILATRRDPVAQMQLQKTELELALANEAADDSEVDTKADALRKQLEQHYESRGTYVYQSACDTLGFYYLRNCDRELASKWYGEELSARDHQSSDTEPRWLRPPDKLMLFYMFASYWNMNGEDVGMANCLLQNGTCNPPIDEQDRCDFKSMFEEKLRNPNKDYQEKSAWTKNTVVEDGGRKLRGALEISLKKGWRY